ncbi:8719_t:CDS:2 [Funneliformis mosseae]|uniref:8719_t:CDS:1 n=1 Tax=Funneliformis mosseae TaxID=27381 RepID=A0A9N9G1Y4_FUNMO|nr:8719_t:CDS:2 [Funneliformis mosseae]
MPVPIGNQVSPSVLLPFPPLTEQHILNCVFSSWYNNFRRVTLKSKIIKPLPEEFIEYLHADGVFLPEQNYIGGNHLREQPLPSFPELEQQIWDTIDEFDGAVFPKLNWSSPRDATWISATNTLKCNSPSDIFLLLKSSDFVAHDLDHAFDDCHYNHQDAPRRHRPNVFELVLKKWYDVAPSMEFRCFVKEEELVDVFDVYVTRNRERVWLIDFNPYGPMTDSLMYTWEEILTATGPPSFRLITSQTESSQSRSQPFAVNRYPREIFDLSQGQSIAEFAEQFQRELAIATVGSDGEENENENNIINNVNQHPQS